MSPSGVTLAELDPSIRRFGGAESLYLSEDQAKLVDRIDRIAKAGIADRAAGYDEAGEFPDDDFDELHREGLLLASLPRPDGGLGFGFHGDDPLCLFLIIERLARVSPSTAHCFQVHCNAMQILREFGSDEQVRRFIQPTIERGALFVGAGSEPGGGRHGSVATPVDGGYRLNGKKHYATNATRSKWMTVHIRAEDTGTLETFVVDRDNPGLDIDASFWNPTGMRACVSPMLTFNDCLVPEDCRLGQPEGFFDRLWLAKINLGFTANYLGSLQGVYDFAVQYLREKKKPEIAPFDTVVGELKARLDATRLLFYHAVKLTRIDLKQGLLASNQAKWLAVENVNTFITAIGQVVGSTALFRGFPLERLYRDMLVHSLHRRHHVGASIVGRAALGMEFDLNQS